MIFFNTVKCPSAAPCNYYDDWLIHMHLWKEQLKCKEKQGNRWPHHCIHSDEKFHRLTDEIFSHPSTSATQTLFTPHHVCLWLWQPDNPPNNPKSIISGCSHLLYQAIRAKNAKSSDCTIWLQSDCQNCFAWASWLDWWPMSFPVDLPFESKIVTLSERRLHALLLCHVLETVDNGFSFFLLCL